MNSNNKTQYTATLIREALQLPADGHEYQQRMIPTGRISKPTDELRNKMRNSAVLVLLREGSSGLELCFTQRKKELKHHPGQISFPGGRRDDSDRNAIETALRETTEEIGISPSNIEILGTLSPVYVYVSNYWVEPIVGYLHCPQDFTINPFEVETAFTQPLERFTTKNFQTTCMVETMWGHLEVPCFEVDGYRIWGATAMILAELSGRVNDYLDRRTEANLNNAHN
jgi:8-oxo-dGTP pyrophosphatase MutT (NUDIX family)